VKVIPDFRPPNYLRLGIAPIYTSFVDILRAIERVKEIMVTQEYFNIDNERPTVT
jgi:kynureninase